MKLLQKPSRFLLLFERCTIPCACHEKRHFARPKVSHPPQFFALLTSKCASRQTACTFSTSQLPKAVWGWRVLYILTSKCASRHSSVHFSTSQLPKVSRTQQLTKLTTQYFTAEYLIFYHSWLCYVVFMFYLVNFTNTENDIMIEHVIFSWASYVS